MSIPPPLHEARIALLIDADNAPAAKIDVILAELAKIGVANIRRAYGNWKKSELRGWEEVLHDYAIRPIQQFDYSKGKNATDMGMVIDAMDLLYTDRPEAFGIVSSDSDFTPLVLHLKAKGAKVYGFGAKKTPLPFVNACSRFLYLENIGQSGSIEDAAEVMTSQPSTSRSGKRGRGGRSGGSNASSGSGVNAGGAQGANAAVAQEPRAADGTPLRMDRSALKRDARLVTLLRNAVESAAGEDGWSALGAVGQQIGNQASFDPRNYGYRKLIDLIDATQLFDLDRRGTQFVLRDKRQGGSPMPTARTDLSRDVSRDSPRDAFQDAPRDAQRDAPRDIQRDARDAARDVFLDLQREVAQEDERGLEEEGFDDHDDGRDPRHELSIEPNGNTSDGFEDDPADDASEDGDLDAPDEARQATPRESRRDAPRDTPRDPQRNAPRESQRNLPRDAQRDAPRGGRRDAPRDARRDPPRNNPGNNSGNNASRNAGSNPRDAQRPERGGRGERNDRNDRSDRSNAHRPVSQPNPSIGRPVDRHPFELPADSPARQFANAFRDPPYQAWEPEFDEPVTAASPAEQPAARPVAAPMTPTDLGTSGDGSPATDGESPSTTDEAAPAAKRRAGRSSKRRGERAGGDPSASDAASTDIAQPPSPAPIAAPAPASRPESVALPPAEPPVAATPAAPSRNRRPKKSAPTAAQAESPAMAEEAAVAPDVPAQTEPAAVPRKRPARKSTPAAAKKATSRKA